MKIFETSFRITLTFLHLRNTSDPAQSTLKRPKMVEKSTRQRPDHREKNRTKRADKASFDFHISNIHNTRGKR